MLAARRWRPWEPLLWLAAFAAPLLLPRHALIVNEIAIVALFAVSLDLVLGYTGIVSLGHAAFFGMGAYAAALFAKHVMPDPLAGLAFGIVTATVLGAVCSVTIQRGSDLTRLMVTLGVGLILLELANKLDWLTGGADGLQGVVMGPLLGSFEFDLSGRTAAWYSLTVLLVFFVLARRLVNSPMGATLKAIRDNRLRAMAIGISVGSRLSVVYTIAAGMAGAAGALLAQTTGFASLDVFEFHRSADVMLMLVVGGTGLALWRRGRRRRLQADAGRAVSRYAAVLDVLARAVPRGAGAGRTRPADPALDLVLAQGDPAMTGEVVLSCEGLVKRFGGITATDNVTLNLRRGARHALIGPNGAGKTTLINLLTGVLEPTEGRIALEGQDVTRLAPHQRVRRGMVRTFQINQLFNSMTPLETLTLVISQQQGLGARFWQPLGASRPVADRALKLLEQFRLAEVMNQRTEHLPYGKRRLLEIAIALACDPRVLLLDEPVAGVPPGEREELLQTVAALPADVSVLLIEHDMDLVFSFANRMTVMVNGAVLTEGDPQQIANDPQVKAVYLGHGKEHGEMGRG